MDGSSCIPSVSACREPCPHERRCRAFFRGAPQCEEPSTGARFAPPRSDSLLKVDRSFPLPPCRERADGHLAPGHDGRVRLPVGSFLVKAVDPLVDGRMAPPVQVRDRRRGIVSDRQQHHVSAHRHAAHFLAFGALQFSCASVPRSPHRSARKRFGRTYLEGRMQETERKPLLYIDSAP